MAFLVGQIAVEICGQPPLGPPHYSSNKLIYQEEAVGAHEEEPDNILSYKGFACKIDSN